MSEAKQDNVTRRDFLYVATGAAVAVSGSLAAWPVIDQMNPDAASLALATIEVDVSQMEEGQNLTVKWRGKPVFIRRRSKQEIDEMAGVPMADLKDPESDEARTKKGHEEFLVMIGSCTHLGCVPIQDSGDYSGWYCPCHGSHYDRAGRIRRGPAPINLVVPEYSFIDGGNIIKIG